MRLRFRRSKHQIIRIRCELRQSKSAPRHHQRLGGVERLESRLMLATVGTGNPAPVLDTSQFPHSAVVQLAMWKDVNEDGEFNGDDDFATCSGAMIGDFHVLTAAHCVYSTRFGPDGKANAHPGWKDRIFVHAARDSQLNRPFGEARSVEMVVPECWLDANPCYQDDVAVITLDRNLGQHTGKFKVGHLASNKVEKAVEYFPYIGQLISAVTNTSPAFVPNKQDISILHYPAEKGFNGVEQLMSTGKTKAISLDGAVLSGDVSDIWVTGGSSGAPVLKGAFDGTQDTIIGVEARADRRFPGESGNFDITRFNEHAVNFIEDILDDYPAPTDRPSLVNYDNWFSNPVVRLAPRHIGEQIAVENRVFNAGTATAHNVAVSFELHHLKSAIVRSLGTVRVASIAPFQTALATTQVQIPYDLPAGEYAIISVIDPDDEIDEFGTPFNDRWLREGVSGISDWYSEKLTIVNDRPEFSKFTQNYFQVYQGESFSYDFTADDPERRPLNWKTQFELAQPGPTFTYSIEPGTGKFQLNTTATTLPFKYQMQITASDGQRTARLPITMEVLNSRPSISGLESNKTSLPNDASELVTLSAVDVKSARKGVSVSRVEFYLDRNGNGLLDVDASGNVDSAKDTLLGFDNTGFDGSTWTGPIASVVGTSAKVFARAVDFAPGGPFRSNIVETALQLFTPPPKPPAAIPLDDQIGVFILGYPSFIEHDAIGNFYAFFRTSSDGIHVQRVLNHGSIVEDAFKLIGAPSHSEIAVRPNGEMLAVWFDSGELRAMRYAANGLRLNNGPLNLGAFTASNNGQLRLEVDESGNFLVAGTRFSGANQVVAKRFGWDGTPLNEEIVLIEKANLATFNLGELKMAPDGYFVVLYQMWNFSEPPEKQWSVRGQMFSPTSQKVGDEFVVADDSSSFPLGIPSINSSKQVVVLFDDPDSDQLMASRYSDQGVLIGSPVRVNTSLSSRLRTAVALSDSGWFTAVWGMQGRDPGDASFEGGVYMQVFDPSNEPRGDETRVPTNFEHDQRDPSVTMDADGDIAILWIDEQKQFDFQSTSVWARVFAINLTPTFGPLPEQTVAVGKDWQVSAAATDPDSDAHSDVQGLRYSLAAGSPAGLTIDAKTGLLRWTPKSEQVGKHLVQVTVTDNGTPARSEILPLVVVVVNPDIQVTSFSAAGSDQVTLSYEILHGAVAPFTVSFVRSSDGRHSSDDVPLGFVSISAEADLSVGIHTKTFTVGAGDSQVPLPGAGAAIAAADFRILAVADESNSIAEHDSHPVDEDNTAVFSGAYHLPGGPVFVHGTNNSDALHMRRGSVVVVLNEQEWTFAENDVAGVQAWLGDSNDLLHGGDVAVGIQAWGGPGDDILSGGASDDQLIGGPGADEVSESPGNDSADTDSTDFSAPILTTIGTTSDTTPSISWSQVNGAVQYEIELRTNSGVLFQESSTTNTAFTFPDPLKGGEYQVQVRAITEDESASFWSPPLLFQVDEPSPAAPTMSGPSGLQEFSRPIFIWNSPAGAVGYELRVQSQGQPAVDITRSVSRATHYVLDVDLAEGSYTATVRAVNSEGDKSELSEAVTFSVDISAPGKPAVIAPTGTIIDTQPDLIWAGVPSAVTYEVQLDQTSPASVDGIYTASQIAIAEDSLGRLSISAPLPEGSYSLRVRGVTALGEVGEWSEPLTFVIDLEDIPPEPPIVLTVPSASAQQELDFSWSGPPQTTSYEVRLQQLSEASPATVFQQDAIKAVELSIPHQFIAGHYQVQVRAFNALGASLWSPPVEFELSQGSTNRAPTGISLSNHSIKERLSGMVVGILAAQDPDSGQSHVFTTNDARFEIVGNELRLKDGHFMELAAGVTVTVTVTATDSGVPPQSQTSDLVLQVTANPSPWKNAAVQFDANGDGRVVPLDVLTLINLLNDNASGLLGPGGKLPASRPGTSTLAYYDPNGDGFCTPNDVLQTINFLNRSSGEAEHADETEFITAVPPLRSHAAETSFPSFGPSIGVAQDVLHSYALPTAERYPLIEVLKALDEDEEREWESLLQDLAEKALAEIGAELLFRECT